MPYDTEHTTYDEFTYELDCLMIGETGEPATEEHLRAAVVAYERGYSPRDCFDNLMEYRSEAA
ncbi:MAG: hypothetical protein IT566_10650 [Rhodospirillaceae bacterium]|nr:hypothetical protein [Rhodospirillaceae bacterium]